MSNTPDWTINVTPSRLTKINTSNGIATYETSGFEKHGFGGEVVVYGRMKDSLYIAGLINNFCDLMIQGDRFDPRRGHYIHNHEYNYHFHVVEYDPPLKGGVKYQLIPIKD